MNTKANTFKRIFNNLRLSIPKDRFISNNKTSISKCVLCNNDIDNTASTNCDNCRKKMKENPVWVMSNINPYTMP